MEAPFCHRLRVRYSECDPQGIVFNAHYFLYFDVALTELWRVSVGPYGEMMEGGVDMAVAEASARFRSPARFDDELDVEIAVERLGTTSMVTALVVRRADTVVAEGRMVHVFVDPATHEKRPIPAPVRAALEPFVVVDAARSST